MTNEPHEETYELVAVNALPSFDPRLKVRDWLLSPSAARVTASITYHCRNLISVGYFTGSVLRYATLLTPVSVGCWCSGLSLVLQIMASVNVFFDSRVMFLREILQCFQSWYFLTCGAIWCITLAIYVGDWRIAMLPSICIDFFNATCTDAHFFDLRRLVIAAIFSALFMSTVAVICMLNVVDSVHNHVMVPTRYRSLTTREAIINTSVILVVLSGRIVFQRHQVLKLRQRRDSNTTRSSSDGIRCIAYHCRLRLQRVKLSAKLSTSPVKSSSILSSRKSQMDILQLQPPPMLSHSCLQLQYVTHGEQFRSSDTLYRLDLATHPSFMRVINGCGVAGWVLTLVAFMLPHIESLAVMSTAFSSVFCSVYVSQYHRRLLCRLYTSFDFVFLIIKVAIAHVCMADLCRWQSVRTWCVWNHFWWIHWALTTDALTPLARQHLRFRAIHSMPVLLGFVIVQVAIAVDVLYLDWMGFQDRAYFQGRVFGHDVAFYVVPMLLSRNFSCIVWCLRLLWRIQQSHSTRKGTGEVTEELVLLLGDVEFDSFHTSRQKRTLVAPNPREPTDVLPSGVQT